MLRYVRRRGVRTTRPKAEQVVATAQVALRLAATERPAAGRAGGGGMGALPELGPPNPRRHRRSGRRAAQDPAGVLLGVPGVGVLTASTMERRSVTRTATATPHPLPCPWARPDQL